METAFTIFLSVIGFVITLLLAVIGFFLRRYITSNDSLKESINLLRVTIATQGSDLGNIRTNCIDISRRAETRLNDHSKRLDDHDVQIAILKNKPNGPKG